MRPELVDLLRCPVCRRALAPAGPSLCCAAGHAFDIARQGYVNLLPGDARPGTADTPPMAAARDDFLRQDHFAGLRDLVSTTAVRRLERDADKRPYIPAIVDVGAGTGYYLAAILDRVPEAVGLALDLSKHSLRRAARAHERAGAIVCDVWRELPLHDGAVELILDVFAPRNAPEFHRILRPEGHLIVVTPTERHQRELVAELGLLSVDERKQERLEEKLTGLFVLEESLEYEDELELDREQTAKLVAMGPSAHHLEDGPLRERLRSLPETVRVTLSVNLAVYRRARPGAVAQPPPA